jgi:hypothetical protein
MQIGILTKNLKPVLRECECPTEKDGPEKSRIMDFHPFLLQADANLEN